MDLKEILGKAFRPIKKYILLNVQGFVIWLCFIFLK